MAQKDYHEASIQQFLAEYKTASKGGRSDVIKKWQQKLGCGHNKIYTILARNKCSSGRKTRSDRKTFSGTMTSTDETLHQALGDIFKIKYPDFPRSLKAAMPTAAAVLSYLEAHPDRSKIEKLLPGEAQINQYFRRMGLGTKQLKTPDPHITLQTLRSNHGHECDASRCKWYFTPKGNIVPIRPGEDYLNKNFWKDGKKIPVQRLLMVDHFSHAFFVRYYLGLEAVDWADFMFHAWSEKDANFPFHGIPDILLLDNDRALRSYAMLQLYEYLNIFVPNVEPYSARVKGSVEVMNRIWEVWFESRLFRNPPTSIDDLNQKAFEFAIWFQNSRIHSRHGQPRFQNWRSNIEGHLKKCPEFDTFRQLLHTKPETRKVNGNGEFTFRGVDYRLENILSTEIDVFIHPFLYSDNQAVTLQYPSRKLNRNNFLTTNVQTLSVLPALKTPNGFLQTSAVLGSYKSHKDSLTQTSMKLLEAQEPGIDIDKASSVETLTESVKAPAFIPVHGHQVQPVSQVPIVIQTLDSIELKSYLADQLHRALDDNEAEYINSLGKDAFTAQETADILEKFKEKSNIIRMFKTGDAS